MKLYERCQEFHFVGFPTLSSTVLFFMQKLLSYSPRFLAKERKPGLVPPEGEIPANEEYSFWTSWEREINSNV